MHGRQDVLFCAFSFSSDFTVPLDSGKKLVASKRDLLFFSLIVSFCVFAELAGMMACEEPSAEVLQSFGSLKAVAAWTNMPENVSKTFFELVGATGDEFLRVLGMLEPDDVFAEIALLFFAGKPPTIIQKGFIRTMVHMCRLVGDTDAPLDTRVEMERRLEEVPKVAEEARAASSKNVQGPPDGPQVLPKQVVSQGSEESVPKNSNEDLLKHWDKFKDMYGRDPRPEEECTGDQLTSVDTLLKRDVAPCVDFGVWGPNRHRLPKKLRNTGLQLHVGGILRIIELSGPLDIYAWTEFYNLLVTALVGFDAAGLGPLLDYSRRLINGYASRYGSLTWPLLYQCDGRCWLEHMERLRRVLERSCGKAESRNQAPPVPFDRARLRDSVWSAAVDGEAPSPVEQQFRGEPRTMPEPKRRRIDKPHVDQANKVHREINGSYTHNRRVVALCAEFQSGNCQRGLPS